MKYNLDNLNSEDFERLVQALAKVLLGNAVLSYGDGTDGGREATFKGVAPYPNELDSWDGYWVIQSKFKSSKEKDFEWVKQTLKTEMDFYQIRKTKVKKPDNYLFFTNARLSAKAVTGGRDKADELQNEFQVKYDIKNLRIIAYDDIVDLINLNRDIAITFAPFILPGDILFNLLNMLNNDQRRNERINEIISRFLEVEFKEDIQSKLDHAGKLTSDKINLEKVFIDLETSYTGIARSQSIKFVDHILSTGNRLLKNRREIESRFVLVAGPGHGKSTLTQFLVQIYRAYFIKNIDKCPNSIDGVDYFITDFKTIIQNEPKWVRLPIKIILKDYAGWIRDRRIDQPDNLVSVINYLQHNIRKKTSSDITTEEIEDLISNVPCFFVFDGLDEVPASSNREDVLTQINFFTDTILRRVNTDSIIISTTRPKGYSKEFDEKKFLHMNILDMSQQLCMLYLKRLLDNIIDDITAREEKFKILKSALNDNVVSRIMKSPLQASIMAILVKSGGEPPTNKFDLFTEYFNIIFTREKQRNILPILSSHPGYVKEIHYILGLYLQTISEGSANPSATINNQEFKSIIRNYLKSMDHKDAEIEKLSVNIWEASTDRLVFISHLQDEKIGFAIRTLQEYFAAVGYTENIKDEDLRCRIGKISTNAYWSNTLLFVIGYLTKHKKYLIDFIESICNELNGSADDSVNQSLNAVVKMGSWLSLDILNEAIFKDNPKLENKFCHLLEDLFSIPVIGKHNDLFRLSDTIIHKWLLIFLNKELEKDQKNLTIWFTVAGLGSNGFSVSHLTECYWPNDQLLQLAVLETFIEFEHYDEFVIGKALGLLSGGLKLQIFEMIDSLEDFKFLSRLSHFATDTQKSIVLEFLLLLVLDGYIWVELKDFCQLLGSKVPDDEDREIEEVIHHSNRQIEVEIVNGLYYKVVKTRIDPNLFTNILYQSAVAFDALIVQKYLQFSISPSYRNLKDLMIELSKEPINYLNTFIQRLSESSSALKLYFNEQSMKMESFEKLMLEIEDLDEEAIHRSSKSIMHYSDYKVNGITSSGNLIDSVREFEERYLSQSYGEKELSCFAFLLHVSDRGLVGEDQNDLRNLAKRYYNELIKSTNYLKGKSLFVVLSCVRMFNVGEAAEILKGVKLSQKISTRPVSLLKGRNSSLFSTTLLHVSDLIKYQILSGEIPSTSLLLQHVYTPTSHKEVVNVKLLPFKELLQLGKDLDYFGGILLLFDPDFSIVHFDILQNLISNKNNSLKSFNHQRLLLFGVGVMTSISFKDQLILFIHQNVEFNQGLQGQFVEVIRQYIGNKPSNIDIDELQII